MADTTPVGHIAGYRELLDFAKSQGWTLPEVGPNRPTTIGLINSRRKKQRWIEIDAIDYLESKRWEVTPLRNNSGKWRADGYILKRKKIPSQLTSNIHKPGFKE